MKEVRRNGSISVARELELMDGERLEFSSRPNPLAFIDLYLIWILIAVVSVAAFLLREAAYVWVSGSFLRFLIDERTRQEALPLLYAMLFLILAVLPIVLFAYYKVAVRWIWLVIILSVGSLLLSVLTDLPPAAIYAVVPAAALLGLSQVELYRRAHRFYLTDRRMVFSRHYPLMTDTETDVYFRHVNSVTVRRTHLDRIFGAGTVIPVMSSGMNLGSEVMELRAGMVLFSLATRKEKYLPRAVPFLCFYSIRGFDRARKLLSERISA